MPYKFSPSSLNLLEECPRCFWLQFNKGIRRPSAVFPSLPSGMDRVLKEHFDRFMRMGKMPPELSEIGDDIRLFDNAELLKLWRNNRKGLTWEDEKGNTIQGALDNLLLSSHEKLIVLDYKTRGFPLKEDTAEHYQNQLDIYNFLLRKNGYTTEDYAYLLFYHPDHVEEDGDVVFNTDLVRMDISTDNAERVFKEALDVLAGEMPKCGEGCEFCALMDIKL